MFIKKTPEEQFEEYWEKVKDNYDYGFKFVMKLMWLTGYKVGHDDGYKQAMDRAFPDVGM